MKKVTFTASTYLPNWLYRTLSESRKRFAHSDKAPNLLGDRDIEWSWVASQIPFCSGAALDFGCGRGFLSLVCARHGYDVTALDLEYVDFPYVHSKIRFLQGDILKLELPKNHFDLVIACSTVEHVGLSGRYGVTEYRRNGDLEAMACINELLKDRGMLIATLPVGRDAVISPLHRVYGEKRLPLLFSRYDIEKEEFWTKDYENKWIPCTRQKALSFAAQSKSISPLQSIYALGLFLLRKP